MAPTMLRFHKTGPGPSGRGDREAFEAAPPRAYMLLTPARCAGVGQPARSGHTVTAPASFSKKGAGGLSSRVRLEAAYLRRVRLEAAYLRPIEGVAYLRSDRRGLSS